MEDRDGVQDPRRSTLVAHTRSLASHRTVTTKKKGAHASVYLLQRVNFQGSSDAGAALKDPIS